MRGNDSISGDELRLFMAVKEAESFHGNRAAPTQKKQVADYMKRPAALRVLRPATYPVIYTVYRSIYWHQQTKRYSLPVDSE